MTYKTLSIKDIKKIIFEGQFKKLPYLKNFWTNPYSCFKGRYYMYCSAILVYFLFRTKITPNMVTIAYGFCGIIGGILLSIPNYQLNIIGIIVFFNKSILDWTDGYLARIKYKTTLTGHILDVYGAVLNYAGFIIGLGFFVYHQTGYEFIIYILAMLAFLNTEVYTSVGKKLIIQDYKVLLNNKLDNNHLTSNKKQKIPQNSVKIKYPKWLEIFKNIFDDRSRSIDFFLLIIMIDIFFNYNLSLYIFLIISLKILVRFILSFFYGVRSKWAELYVEELKQQNK